MRNFKEFISKSIELKESAKIDNSETSKVEVDVLSRFPFILDYLGSISQETYEALRDKISFGDLERFKGRVGTETRIKKGDEGKIPPGIRQVFQLKPYGFMLDKVDRKSPTIEGPGSWNL